MSTNVKPILNLPDEVTDITSGFLFEDEMTLITGHENGDVIKWDLAKNGHNLLHQCGSRITTVSVSQRNEVAVGCHSGLLFTFTLDDPKMKLVQSAGYTTASRVWSSTWTSDNSMLVGSTYGVLTLFERNPEWVRSKIGGHSDSIFGVGSSNNKFVSGDWKGKIFVRQYADGQVQQLDALQISGSVEAISCHKDGAFATIDEYGHINFFEKTEGLGWRSVFETDTASSRGTSVHLTEDGMGVFAGTDTELIQVDVETQLIQNLPIPHAKSIFSNGKIIFVITNRGLLSFERTKILVPANAIKYQYSKVSLIGHTGAGKTTLCSMITSGSKEDIKSTFGKRVWNWNVSVAEGNPERRIVLHDHGGQVTVLDTFLPFLADSDIILIFFKRTDKETFEKALKIREELEMVVTAKTKIYFVETFIDHEVDDIDRTKLANLIKTKTIIANLQVSPTSGLGIEEFKQSLTQTIDWNKARTMIRSEYVESLEKSILALIENKTTVMSFAGLKKFHENNSGHWTATNHLKFLLSNISSQGSIEYYPKVLEMIIFNDEKYNELRSKVPIVAEHNGGILSMKYVQEKFGNIDYIIMLDQLYLTYGIAIENGDLRIFPSKLKKDIGNIPDPYRQQLQNSRHKDEIHFPKQKVNGGLMFKALSELELGCVDASEKEGVFAWENNACIYYKYEEVGDPIEGHYLKFSYSIGGNKVSTYDRLNNEFRDIIERLYGPHLSESESDKKKDLITKKLDVALSFAGEQREYVDQVANTLKRKGVSVFYDEFYRAHLWGKDLSEYLQRVYYSKSSWCIMFISEAYVSKIWPTHERKSALARHVELKGGYILPVRFDDTEVPGLNPSISYRDATKESPIEIANLFIEKLEDSTDW